MPARAVGRLGGLHVGGSEHSSGCATDDGSDGADVRTALDEGSEDDEREERTEGVRGRFEDMSERGNFARAVQQLLPRISLGSMFCITTRFALRYQ